MKTFGELRQKVARGGYDSGLTGPRSGNGEQPGDLLKRLASGGQNYYRDLREVLQARTGRLRVEEYEAIHGYLLETCGKGGYAGMTDGAEKLEGLLNILGIKRIEQ